MMSVRFCFHFENKEYRLKKQQPREAQNALLFHWRNRGHVERVYVSVGEENDLLALQAEDKSLRHITQMVNDCYSPFIPLFIKQV